MAPVMLGAARPTVIIVTAATTTTSTIENPASCFLMPR